MANFITFSVLLAVCCIFSSVHYVNCAPAALKVTIWHAEPESLVRATLSGVTADGVTGDSHTKFFGHSDGSFESVDYPGKYLRMDAAGALTLGVRNEPTYKHKFTRANAGPFHDFLKAVTSSGSTCYFAFDWQGVQVANACDPLSAQQVEQAKLQVRLN